MITRRDVIKDGLGLAAIIASGHAPAALMKGVGARMMGWRSYSARDYVQNGLIAMWDGIENVGWGKHDSNSKTWKDLKGSRDWILGTRGSFDGVSLVSNNYGSANTAAANQEQLPKAYCIECVSQTINGRWMFCGYGIGTGNPGVIQGLCTISGLTGWQPSFTYPTATVTKWVGCNVKNIGSVSINYEDYNTQSTKTKDGYVNGKIYTGSISSGNYWKNDGQSHIGRCGDTSTSGWSWSGNIYSLRMYSRNLSVSEIAHNYAIDKIRFNLP